MNSAPFDVSCLYLTAKNDNLIPTLIQYFGDPVDSYWNGSHTWFSATNETELEWRLHPVAGFKMPKGARPEELFELAIEGEVDITHYWEGLEVFSFDDTKLTPENLSNHCLEVIGSLPDFVGLVDHESIAQKFERSNGDVSIVQLLIEQLNS